MRGRDPPANLTTRRAGAAVVGLLVLEGCSPSVARGGGYCAPPSVPSFSVAPDKPPPDGAPREAHLAALLGLSGASVDPAADGNRGRVIERVQLASLAIEATAAELDCEAERAEQAADYLVRGQTESAQALTIASIVAAGLTGIAGVLLSTGARPAVEQDTVAISGGVVTSGLGLGSLFVHPRTNFDHPRNLLADVWRGPSTSPAYPPVVWAYLTRHEFSNSERVTIRENMVARWTQFRAALTTPIPCACAPHC
jgi:hypothetical protein